MPTVFRNKPVLFLMAALLTLSGCDNNNNNNSSNQSIQRDYQFDTSHSSWLRNHLPEQTVAYASMPNLWNALFDPKADSLHPIQQQPAFQEQVAQIKKSAADKYLKLIPKDQQPLVNTLLRHHSGPIELALLNYSAASLMPNVAVATTLTDFSADQVDQLINNSLQQIAPQLTSEVTKTDKLTQWQFNVQSVTNHIQYDEDSGQLLLLSGLGASKQKLDDLWLNKTTPTLEKITQLDKQSDPSGLNLKAWVAVSKLYKLGAAFLPPQQRTEMEKFAVDQMEYVWLGTESAQGKSALSFHVIMPEAGWRLFLPRQSSPLHSGGFDVTLAGKPDSVFQMALPDLEQLKAAADLIDFSDEETKTWSTISGRFAEVMGFEAADILKAYDQNLLMGNDQAGRWLAIKVKDQKLHQNIVNKFSSLVKATPNTQSLAGVKINQMHFSGLLELFLTQKQEDLPKDFKQISQVLGMFKQHSYWVRQDDVIYFATVPQILAEKFNSNETLKLSDWLQHNQQVNWDSAILAYGKEIDNLPRDIYNVYLSVIQVLGDMAGTHVDLFQLPTASELQLPKTGRMNMALSSDSEKVSLTLAYEYSIIEGFLNSDSNMMSMYTIAILMSYALPAYRDYTVRAKIGGALAQVSEHKQIVAQHYLDEGQFEDTTIVFPESDFQVEFDYDAGTLAIKLQDVDPTFKAGDYLYLNPEIEEGYGVIRWHCDSNAKPSYLPNMCRN